MGLEIQRLYYASGLFQVSTCSLLYISSEVICSVSESKYIVDVLSDNYGSSSSQ